MSKPSQWMIGALLLLTAAVWLGCTEKGDSGSTELKKGGAVWAETATKNWAQGKLDKDCENGGKVVRFNDGAESCVAFDLMLPDFTPTTQQVEVNYTVIAPAADGKMYPASVTAISPEKRYTVKFDHNGETAEMPVEQLRLRH